MTLPELEAAWDAAHNECHALIVQYETELSDREAISKAVIRQELAQLRAQITVAEAKKSAALNRYTEAKQATYPGRPECPAAVDPPEIPSFQNRGEQIAHADVAEYHRARNRVAGRS